MNSWHAGIHKERAMCSMTVLGRCAHARARTRAHALSKWDSCAREPGRAPYGSWKHASSEHVESV